MDTNIASYIINGRFPAIRRRLDRVPMERICVSVVTEGELRYGLARRPDALRLKMIVDEFLLRVAILPWDSGAAQVYGRLRASLGIEGRPMGNLDIMIAAHAVHLGAILVTNDHAFVRIKALKTADWTVS